MARSSERVRSSVDCDIQVPPWPQSCRRSTGQTVPTQPDDFVPAMRVAVLVLAEVAAAINSSYGELRRYTQNAFSRQLRRPAAQRLRNCAELLRTRVDGRYAGGMSEATPTPVEPPTPSAEQLAEWRTLA